MTSVQGLLETHDCLGSPPGGPSQADVTGSRPRPWGSISLQRLNFCSNAASLLNISSYDRAAPGTPAESELWQVRNGGSQGSDPIIINDSVCAIPVLLADGLPSSPLNPVRGLA